MRLFSFPHAGAGAAVYFSWSAWLERHGIELRAIQYPGREDRSREPPFAALGPMVTGLADAWMDLVQDGQYSLFGHSMGAAIAFELTRELVRRGGCLLPTTLFLSGRNPPHLRTRLPAICHMDDQEFVDRLRTERGFRLPDEIISDQDVRSYFLPILRADYALSDSSDIKDGEPLPVRLSIFGGNDDPWTSRPALAEWRRYTTYPCRLRMIRGDHFFHQSASDHVLSAIVEDLRRSGSDAPSSA